MDIKQEIFNHLEWIEKIAALIGNEDLTEEDLHTITQHDKCALGKWLASDSAAIYRDLPEFEGLVENHDAFHKLAGSLISAFRQGNEQEAIKSGVEFIEMSQKVIGHLQSLQDKTTEDMNESGQK